MIPTRAVARRFQHDRLSGGDLRHPLRQQGKYRALPFGSRAAPFADLGDGATAARAKPCARIERADRNAWRFRRLDHRKVDTIDFRAKFMTEISGVRNGSFEIWLRKSGHVLWSPQGGSDENLIANVKNHPYAL